MKLLLLLILLFLNMCAKELILPIDKEVIYNKQKAKLGKKLFHEKRLSKDNTISCASCHIIADGGDDNRQFPLGVGNKTGNMNSPTVLNSKYNFEQFWDGRAKDLKEQASGPIHNPVEMDTNFEDVIKKLKKDSEYPKLFKKIYADGMTKINLIDAIVEFENALITPNSRFDRFLLGEKEILTQDEKDGFKLFKDIGCISCHNGVNIGGNLYQKMGIIKRYKSKVHNLGRYEVTQDEEDKYFYKVPTLRNIELTAPYLHDGSRDSLKNAVKIMAEYQVGILLEESEVDKLVKFLKTLSGEQPKVMD